ncbi:hypothetical protein [Bacillus albus]
MLNKGAERLGFKFASISNPFTNGLNGSIYTNMFII